MGALGVEFVLFDQAGRCIYHEVYQYILPCFVFIPAQAIRRCFPWVFLHNFCPLVPRQLNGNG